MPSLTPSGAQKVWVGVKGGSELEEERKGVEKVVGRKRPLIYFPPLQNYFFLPFKKREKIHCNSSSPACFPFVRQMTCCLQKKFVLSDAGRKIFPHGRRNERGGQKGGKRGYAFHLKELLLFIPNPSSRFFSDGGKSQGTKVVPFGKFFFPKGEIVPENEHQIGTILGKVCGASKRFVFEQNWSFPPLPF